MWIPSEAPSRPPRLGEAITAQGPRVENIFRIWSCKKAEVVVLKFGFALTTVPLQPERDKRVRLELRNFFFKKFLEKELHGILNCQKLNEVNDSNVSSFGWPYSCLINASAPTL